MFNRVGANGFSQTRECSLSCLIHKRSVEPWKDKNLKPKHLRVKLQTVLFLTHLHGGSKPRNVMMRVWNVTGTNIKPTTQTKVHWNLPMLPTLERKPSTLRVIVLVIWKWEKHYWELISELVITSLFRKDHPCLGQGGGGVIERTSWHRNIQVARDSIAQINKNSELNLNLFTIFLLLDWGAAMQ